LRSRGRVESSLPARSGLFSRAACGGFPRAGALGTTGAQSLVRAEQELLTSHLLLERLLARQVGDVLRRKEPFVLVQHRVACDRLILLRAQNEADGWSVAFGATLRVEESHVAVHLSDVLMCEFSELEVDEQVALENNIVEDQVD